MKKILVVIGLLLAVSLFCFTGCKKENSAVLTFDHLQKSVPASEEKSQKQLYVSKNTTDSLEKVLRSDMLTLYLDRENYGISVYDATSKQLWSALPREYGGERPAVLTVDVIAGSKVYTFNSQDDSVKQGLAKASVSDNALEVSYSFEKEVDEAGKVSFNVLVKYTISNGTLSAEVDCSKLQAGNFLIKDICLLGYFGSGRTGEKGDYILIPDGSGAIIDTAKAAKKFEEISVSVYGGDIAAKENASAKANAAIFGMKRGNGAFVAMIEEADAVAKINAAKALEKKSYNKVGAVFSISAFSKKKDGTAYAAAKPYSGRIKLTYHFLSGESTDYASMASVCRESLVRSGILSMQSEVSAEREMPFVLDIIGCADIGNEKSKSQVLTGYEQAVDLLSFFRSKGFGNIVVKYRGVFEGGLSQNDIKKANFNTKLGSKKQAEELFSYASTQNIKIYADAKMISAGRLGKNRAAADLTGEAVEKEITYVNTPAMSAAGKSSFIRANAIEESTNLLLYKVKNSSFDGICLDDAGKYIYSDYSSENSANAVEVHDVISAQCSAVSSCSGLMVDGGNIYSIKYADYITNLPQTASVASRQYCTQIPFLQILLHGVVSYSGTPLNLCKSAEKALLNAAEYGNILSFQTYYSDLSTEKATDKLCYLSFGQDFQNLYERLNEKLADLSSKKITAHRKIRDGVYCTTYGDSVNVYVNYTGKDVKVSGVNVEAKSFMRIG